MKPTYSNCPFAIFYLVLRGKADRVVATRANMPWYVKPWFPWHLGGVLKDRVFHFKYTRHGQDWAPFWFEGSMRRTTLTALTKAGSVLWIRPAWLVFIHLALMLAVVILPWMVVAALSWPCWLAREGLAAALKRATIRKRLWKSSKG